MVQVLMLTFVGTSLGRRLWLGGGLRLRGRLWFGGRFWLGRCWFGLRGGLGF